MTSLPLRAATIADAPMIAALVNSAYRGESSKKGWTTEADFLGGQRIDVDLLSADLVNPARAVLLFEQEGKLTACISLERRADCAYLGMVTVDPEAQGTGIGKALLAGAEDWIRHSWRLFRVEITVITRRMELIAWYKRRGYRETPRREPFPYHDQRFGLPQVPDLEMMVMEKLLAPLP